MTWRTLRDRFAHWLVTPAIAAQSLSNQARAKRQREALTLAEKKAATTAELRAWVESRRSQTS